MSDTIDAPVASGDPEPTDVAGRPLRLLVIGDSTAFTDHRGPQLPDVAHLYPNVLARELEAVLGRRVIPTVLARPGQTVREAARAVTKDRHVQFDLVAGADAIVVGVGSFDHAPGGIPPVVEVAIPHLRPDGVRRRVRGALRRAYPWAVRLTLARRRRTPAPEFERLFVQLLDQLRGLSWGRAAGAVLGPTSHRADYYARRHPRFPAAQAHHLRLAGAHGFAPVAAWEHVEPWLDRLNPDGIHWPPEAHTAIGRALAAALLPQLTGAEPPIGLPAAAREALDRHHGGGPSPPAPAGGGAQASASTT